MDKIKALLEKAGVKSELADQICESLANYKTSLRQQFNQEYAAKVEQAKKVLVYAAGAAVQKHMAELDRQQEILLVLADMVMDVYAADSVVARVGQFIDAHGAERAATRRAVARIVAAETYRDVAVRARDLASHLANNPGRMVAGVDRLSPFIATDLIAARRLVSDHVIDVGRYPF
jgi:hypothetical protein